MTNNPIQFFCAANTFLDELRKVEPERRESFFNRLMEEYCFGCWRQKEICNCPKLVAVEDADGIGLIENVKIISREIDRTTR